MAQDNGNDTVSERLLKYKARVRRIQWLGAGLGAEVAIFVGIFSDTANEGGLWTQVPAFLTVVFILCGALGLLYSIADFDWRVDMLQQIINDNGEASKKRVGDYFRDKPDVKWPDNAEKAFTLQIFGVAAAALAIVCLLLAAMFGSAPVEVPNKARQTSEEATPPASRSVSHEELKHRAREAFSDP